MDMSMTSPNTMSCNSLGCIYCRHGKRAGVWRSSRRLQHAVPTIGYRSSGGLADSIIDGVTGVLVDSRAELVNRLQQLLGDRVLRDQLGAKAQARSAEFSWKQSADAMRAVMESVMAGDRVSGLVGS